MHAALETGDIAVMDERLAEAGGPQKRFDCGIRFQCISNEIEEVVGQQRQSLGSRLYRRGRVRKPAKRLSFRRTQRPVFDQGRADRFLQKELTAIKCRRHRIPRRVAKSNVSKILPASCADIQNQHDKAV